MKNIIRISALMCAMAFLTTSCVKDELFDEPQQKPAAVGDEIIFGSRAGFENSDKTTRTVYSGETYTKDGVTFERIDWIDSTEPEVMDRVQIYSPQAANGPVADYFVYANSQADDEDDKTNDIKDEGYLVKVQDNALQWGSKNSHEFYAMYPATSSFKEEVTIAMGIKMDGTTLRGVVPSAQVPGTKGDKKGVEKVDGYGYVAHPNMDYAYMAAKAVASPEDGAVSLDFVPIVTAVEIELLADQTMTISELYVSGDNKEDAKVQYLAGAFTADLSNWTGTYPTCENQATYTHTFTNDKGVSQTLTLNQEHTIYYSLGGQYTINKDEKLKFTVFLRPGVDYTNLTVGFSETGAAYLSKTLGTDAAALTIPQHKKTQFKNVQLPLEDVVITWDASNWMESLPDDRQMAYLSLPGTGGSFSYAYNGSNPQYYRQQNLDFNFEAQWKAGIRAFELVVDRHSDTSTSLGSAVLKCNKTAVTTTDGTNSISITFDDAINTLIDNIKEHNNECAVVILTYQPEDNDPGRNASAFAQNLNAWWTKIKEDNKDGYFIKYTPTTKLREGEVPAAGKIMLIVRINQRDEIDDGDYTEAVQTLANCPFVLIDGCGTAKDRWGARGYTINDKRAPDISNNDALLEWNGNDASYIECFMHDKKTSWVIGTTYTYGCSDYIFKSSPYSTSYTTGDYTIKRPDSKGEANFGFETDSTAVKCWYQEWARVVPSDMKTTGIGTFALGLIPTASHSIYWFESLTEKKMNIESTFKMAINSNPTVDKTIYINSLCGYLVTTNFADSYTPSLARTYGGSGGDIQALAKTVATDYEGKTVNGLNAWFEAMVNDSQMEQTAGPTGIIMMDYVEPTDLVIGTIISNNFKYSK